MTDYFAILESRTSAGRPATAFIPLPLLIPKTLAMAMPVSDEAFYLRLQARLSYFALVIVTILFVGAVIFAWSP